MSWKKITTYNFASLSEQKVDILQKENAEQKLDLDECRGKLELAETFAKELQGKLEEAKNEIFKLQESVKRYKIFK